MGMRNSILLMAVLAIVLLTLQPAMGATINITSCNPTFNANTTGATYAVTANLAPAANQSCIVVSAAGVTVNMGRFTLTGAGTTPGIGVIIQNAGLGTHLVGGIISGFTTGVQVNASNVLMEALNVKNNLGSGVIFKAVNGSILATSSITGNGTNGVWMLNTRQGVINHNVAISGNGTTGPGYGVFIQNNATATLSYDNVVSDNVFGTGGPQLAGVWVGTSNNAPLSCGTAGAPSTGNVIVGNQNLNSGASVGIGLECGFASSNIVTDNTASGNVSFDLFDGNATCDANTWIADVFGTANQSCIH